MAAMSGEPGEPGEPALHLRLFGRFSARIDGAPLGPLASRKGQWLLALLALRGGKPVERGWLLAQLWPESDEPRAYRNLRQTLFDLRKALGPAAALLESPTPRTLRLRVGGAAGAEVDALAFDADVSTDDAARLARAGRDPLSDSPHQGENIPALRIGAGHRGRASR